MAGSPTTVSELLGLLATLDSEKDAITQEYETRLASVETYREHVRGTLALLGHGGMREAGLAVPVAGNSEAGNGNGDQDWGTLTETPRTSEPATTLSAWPEPNQPRLPGVPGSAGKGAPKLSAGEWLRQFQGMTQKQAIVRIAELAGGAARVSEIRDILVATRLAKGKPANIPPHIYHMAEQSELFEKPKDGVLTLKQPAAINTSETHE